MKHKFGWHMPDWIQGCKSVLIYHSIFTQLQPLGGFNIYISKINAVESSRVLPTGTTDNQHQIIVQLVTLCRVLENSFKYLRLNSIYLLSSVWAGGKTGHSIQTVFIHSVVKHHQLWQLRDATIPLVKCLDYDRYHTV